MALVLTGLFFVISGDSWTFLPPAARNASRQTRQFFGNLWPSWLKPVDTNEQRQQEVEQLN